MAGVPNFSATSSRRHPPTVSVPSPSRTVPGGKRPSSSPVFTSVWIVTASACHSVVGCERTAKKFTAASLSVMIPTDMRPTKRQQQGEQSRELILDATERLMATRGYAATSISDIRKACGLPPSSIYWHFGSKEGVLAAVMQRGADRFFAAIPTSDDAEVQLAVLSMLQSQHPDFLRLFYMLSLERNNDPAVAAVVRRVRDTAITRFHDAITRLLPGDAPRSKADRVVTDLTALAVALSDGVYFADHLESDTDVEQMYRQLFQALKALIPILLEDK